MLALERIQVFAVGSRAAAKMSLKPAIKGGNGMKAALHANKAEGVLIIVDQSQCFFPS